jgi:hypothetical protein
LRFILGSIAEGDIDSSGLSTKAVPSPNRGLEIAVTNLQDYCNGWFFIWILIILILSSKTLSDLHLEFINATRT